MRKHGSSKAQGHQPRSSFRGSKHEGFNSAPSSWNRSGFVVNRTSSRFVAPTATACVASARDCQAVPKRLYKPGASRSSSCFGCARLRNRQLFWRSSRFGFWRIEWVGSHWLPSWHCPQATSAAAAAATSRHYPRNAGEFYACRRVLPADHAGYFQSPGHVSRAPACKFLAVLLSIWNVWPHRLAQSAPEIAARRSSSPNKLYTSMYNTPSHMHNHAHTLAIDQQ